MAFGFINRAIIRASADRLAEKASSKEAFDGGISTAFSLPETIETYFNKYGSTERKFDFHPHPGFYIGYVKVGGNDEFLSVVLMRPNGSVLASFSPELRHSQDMLGLMGKKEFADQVASSFTNAGASR